MEQKGEATRDILWQTLDNLAYKMEILATYHLPLLVKTYGLEDSNGRKIMHHELLHQQQEAKPSTSKEEKKPQEIEEMGEGSRASSEEEPGMNFKNEEYEANDDLCRGPESGRHVSHYSWTVN